ncbi:MAG: aminotransferase class I/II-fold pyridoxal phosphate-dependent enzyme [Clostridia bacterium]|nr:aminotransferase class I/II-fold pyridoxal phosphate-dependent enzyme [Clostridia bacterium]
MLNRPIILESLKEYYKSGITPMHMPGHKRNIKNAPFLSELSFLLDITEIDNFDNLHNPQGLLATAMQNAADLWESKASYFLVNGSTCGILASIRSVATTGGEVIVARNCHKSVYNAIELCGLTPHFILPCIDNDFGIYGSITPQQIKDELNQYPDTKLIILTSPTYEGVISDINSICKIAHDKNVPVLVDEAHGAHLGFYGFPNSAVKSGADIIIQSLHKTLPSLTQTAIAHINGNIISKQKFLSQLAIFETSSPSYLLMASIDGCVNLIQEDGERLFTQWQSNLQKFNSITKNLNHIKTLRLDMDKAQNHPDIFEFDKSKIVISTINTNLNGTELAQILRDEYKIEIEMASTQYIIAMTGLGDTESSILKLANALLEIDSKCTSLENRAVNDVLHTLPQIKCSINKALNVPSKTVNINDAVGKTIGEYIWAYPPGVPIIIPGEEIDSNIINTLKTLCQNGVDIKSTSGSMPDLIEVTC